MTSIWFYGARAKYRRIRAGWWFAIEFA
eukprot:SAG31_NODE_38445_length_296_cov_0.776650_1_plen_27_part_01